ncbi:MAG: serine hydrolase domain-containing protein, partial [Microbacterium sp.]
LGALALAVGLSACAPDVVVEIDVPAQADAQLADDTLAQLQTAVTDAMSATGSSGAIVGVWVPWGGTWVTGLGTTTPTDDTEVTADMTFRVADVTRAMTCDALYALVADGTVSLDDSITEYVSGVPDLAEVTLRQLCDGTAGIGSYQSTLLKGWLANPARVWKPRELASYGLGKKRTTEPGEAWRDSDAGYVLLGLALSRAADKSASKLLSDEVFAPLELDDTSLPEGDGQWADGGSLRGTLSRKTSDGTRNCAEPTDVTDVSTSTGYTDSGVVSTIGDLGRYAQALATGALAAADDEDAQARWADPKSPSEDAPAWFTTTGGAYQAGTLIGQYGSVPGYLTAAFADPETGLTVAVVLNNSASSATQVLDLALELAAIASKAPAAEGETAPQFGLPWTAEQYHEAIAEAAVCSDPAS